jgi:Leucine-rich repeat (LRR) protein
MSVYSSSNPLTREIILEKCKKTDNFNEIKNLNLWGSDLDDISLIKQLPNLEVVSLSCNRISTLVHFGYCPRIIELYLRKNLIADLKEIQHLQNLKNLRVLWLSDNPCSQE